MEGVKDNKNSRFTVKKDKKINLLLLNFSICYDRLTNPLSSKFENAKIAVDRKIECAVVLHFPIEYKDIVIQAPVKELASFSLGPLEPIAEKVENKTQISEEKPVTHAQNPTISKSKSSQLLSIKILDCRILCRAPSSDTYEISRSKIQDAKMLFYICYIPESSAHDPKYSKCLILGITNNNCDYHLGQDVKIQIDETRHEIKNKIFGMYWPDALSIRFIYGKIINSSQIKSQLRYVKDLFEHDLNCRKLLKIKGQQIKKIETQAVRRWNVKKMNMIFEEHRKKVNSLDDSTNITLMKVTKNGENFYEHLALLDLSHIYSDKKCAALSRTIGSYRRPAIGSPFNIIDQIIKSKSSKSIFLLKLPWEIEIEKSVLNKFSPFFSGLNGSIFRPVILIYCTYQFNNSSPILYFAPGLYNSLNRKEDQRTGQDSRQNVNTVKFGGQDRRYMFDQKNSSRPQTQRHYIPKRVSDKNHSSTQNFSKKTFDANFQIKSWKTVTGLPTNHIEIESKKESESSEFRPNQASTLINGKDSDLPELDEIDSDAESSIVKIDPQQKKKTKLKDQVWECYLSESESEIEKSAGSAEESDECDRFGRQLEDIEFSD